MTAEVAALVQALDQPFGDRDLLVVQQGADVGEDLLAQARFGGDQGHRVEVVLGDAIGGLLGQDLGMIFVARLLAIQLLVGQAGRAVQALHDAAADRADLLVLHLQRRIRQHFLANDFLQFLAGQTENVVGFDQARRDPRPHFSGEIHAGIHAHSHRHWRCSLGMARDGVLPGTVPVPHQARLPDALPSSIPPAEIGGKDLAAQARTLFKADSSLSSPNARGVPASH